MMARRLRKIPSLIETMDNLPSFLAEPIERPDPELAFPRTLLTADQSDWEAAHAEARAKIEAERDRRFAQLTGLFTNADLPDWRAIARRIAVEFIPGFQVVEPPRRRGRKPGKLVDRSALLNAVNELLAMNEGWSVPRAIQALRRNPHWGESTPQSLLAMYYEAKAVAGADAKLAVDRIEFLKRINAGVPPSVGELAAGSVGRDKARG